MFIYYVIIACICMGMYTSINWCTDNWRDTGADMFMDTGIDMSVDTGIDRFMDMNFYLQTILGRSL